MTTSPEQRPPNWADRFLEWYCDPGLLDEIQGDLWEAFELRVQRHGLRKARWLFIKEVLLFFRPSVIRKSLMITNHSTMTSLFQNYLKVAWRNALKSKTFSLINITGLAIGMAACLLIFQYVNFEQSYDRFHENEANIYRVELDRFYPDRVDKSAGVTAFVGPALKETYPEVQQFTKLWGTSHVNNILIFGEESVPENQLFYADEHFFEVFSYQLQSGDPATALAEPFSMVLTERLARKLFGDEDALGRSIEYAGGYGRDQYRITGIVKDVPENTHLKFNCLVSFQTLVSQTEGKAANAEGWSAFLTYLLLEPDADALALEARLPDFVQNRFTMMLDNGAEVALKLQPLSDIHLKSSLRFEPGTNGNYKIVRVLFFTALFILGIAWINYINLATAKAMERAREVGVRKVVGAGKRDLRRQFLTEAVLLNVAGLALALGLTWLVSPLLNQLTGVQVPAFSFLQDPAILLGMVGVLALGILLSGFYPAFVISSFSPGVALSGKAAGVSGLGLRKALVVFQFGISIVLIAGSFIIFRQVRYMMKKDIGMNIDQVLVLKGAGLQDSTYAERLDHFKERLLNNAVVAHVTNSTDVPGKEITWVNNAVRWAKQPETNLLSLPFIGVDHDFFDTYELPLISGRTFSDNPAADADKIVLTKSAAKVLGFADQESAIDEEVIDNGNSFRVIGVVEDYHQESLSFDYRPVVFRNIQQASSFYSVKLQTDQLNESIASIQQEWKTAFPGNPFIYFFQDEYFGRQYRSDQLFGRLFGIFTALGVFVACIGLLGLSSFTVYKRTREIGIRKVLGANTAQILLLISREHFLLILLAALIGAPLAWWGMSIWLSSYAFAIELHWWYFLLPIVVLLLIAGITISFHAIRAAMTNPVQAIHH